MGSRTIDVCLVLATIWCSFAIRSLLPAFLRPAPLVIMKLHLSRSQGHQKYSGIKISKPTVGDPKAKFIITIRRRKQKTNTVVTIRCPKRLAMRAFRNTQVTPVPTVML